MIVREIFIIEHIHRIYNLWNTVKFYKQFKIKNVLIFFYLHSFYNFK